MATHFGRIQEFQPEFDTIKAYLEQVQLYFTANDIADGKQVPILHELNWSAHLLSPQQPNATSTKSLADIFCSTTPAFRAETSYHCGEIPFPQTRSTCRRDYRRVRCGSTKAHRSLQLRRVPRGWLSVTALCVGCGTKQSSIDYSLKKSSSYTKAMELLTAIRRCLRDLSHSSRSSPAPLPNPGRGKPAINVVGPNHDPNDCKFKDAECHTMQEEGT